MRITTLALAPMFASALVAAPALAQDAKLPTVPAPAAIVADGIPAVPVALRDATLPYMEFRSAAFLSWNPGTKGMLLSLIHI